MSKCNWNWKNGRIKIYVALFSIIIMSMVNSKTTYGITINDNGNVEYNLDDAKSCLKMAVGITRGTLEDKFYYDINRDDKIDLQDAKVILKNSVGIIGFLGINENDKEMYFGNSDEVKNHVTQYLKDPGKQLSDEHFVELNKKIEDLNDFITSKYEQIQNKYGYKDLELETFTVAIYSKESGFHTAGAFAENIQSQNNTKYLFLLDENGNAKFYRDKDYNNNDYGYDDETLVGNHKVPHVIGGTPIFSHYAEKELNEILNCNQPYDVKISSFEHIMSLFTYHYQLTALYDPETGDRTNFYDQFYNEKYDPFPLHEIKLDTLDKDGDFIQNLIDKNSLKEKFNSVVKIDCVKRAEDSDNDFGWIAYPHKQNVGFLNNGYERPDFIYSEFQPRLDWINSMNEYIINDMNNHEIRIYEIKYIYSNVYASVYAGYSLMNGKGISNMQYKTNGEIICVSLEKNTDLKYPRFFDDEEGVNYNQHTYVYTMVNQTNDSIICLETESPDVNLNEVIKIINEK